MSILKNAQTDTHIVRQFLLSNIVLNAVDEKIQLRKWQDILFWSWMGQERKGKFHFRLIANAFLLLF
jgi:thiamine phosphate synthase YjbQ (UPF0047 family)